MDDVVDCIMEYIRWVEEYPITDETPTREVTADIRSRLDAACPKWREETQSGSPLGRNALVVEMHMSGGRTIRCALTQRPTPVSNTPE